MAEKMIGKVTHYFGHVNAAVIELSDSLKVGEKIHVKGHSEDFIQTVDSMQVEHKAVEEAKAGESVGIKIQQKVHEHDAVYRVVDG